MAIMTQSKKPKFLSMNSFITVKIATLTSVLSPLTLLTPIPDLKIMLPDSDVMTPKSHPNNNLSLFQALLLSLWNFSLTWNNIKSNPIRINNSNMMMMMKITNSHLHKTASRMMMHLWCLR